MAECRPADIDATIVVNRDAHTLWYSGPLPFLSPARPRPEGFGFMYYVPVDSQKPRWPRL